MYNYSYSSPSIFESAAFWLIVIVFLLIQIFGAMMMTDAAKKKGYGDEEHVFLKCFLLGIYGYLYVLALPDKTLQKQSEEINKKIADSSKNPEELPDL